MLTISESFKCNISLDVKEKRGSAFLVPPLNSHIPSFLCAFLFGDKKFGTFDCYFVDTGLFKISQTKQKFPCQSFDVIKLTFYGYEIDVSEF